MSVADKLECYLFRRQSGSEENSAELEVFVAHRTWLVVFKKTTAPPSIPPFQFYHRQRKKQLWMLQLDCVESLLKLLTFAPDKHCFPVQRQRLQIHPISGETAASAVRPPPGPHATPRCFREP